MPVGVSPDPIILGLGLLGWGCGPTRMPDRLETRTPLPTCVTMPNLVL